MPDFPKKLSKKLNERKENGSLRSLPKTNDLVDFSSNDYLGFARSGRIQDSALSLLNEARMEKNGATGSRLLTGNHPFFERLENQLADYFECESALVFNSGYDANIGFFSSVPQRGDIVLYDELIHASIRDGIHLGRATYKKFKHNDFKDLGAILGTGPGQNDQSEIYVVTESIFSMDGDSPDLISLAALCEKNGCHLIVDEAHAIGVIGEYGEGMVKSMNLGDKIFATIITFGKAMGCHGAAILSCTDLRNYLVNFARSFIYTTGLSPHSVASVLVASELLFQSNDAQQQLQDNIEFFKDQLKKLNLRDHFVTSDSAVHCCIVPSNEKVISVAEKLMENGFNVMPIRYPSVKKGQERLRFCLHSFNSKQEIADSLILLAKFI